MLTVAVLDVEHLHHAEARGMRPHLHRDDGGVRDLKGRVAPPRAKAKQAEATVVDALDAAVGQLDDGDVLLLPLEDAVGTIAHRNTERAEGVEPLLGLGHRGLRSHARHTGH